MFLIRIWNESKEMYTWKVKSFDKVLEPHDQRRIYATLKDGREIMISPSFSHTIIIEEIPDEEDEE